MLDNLSSALAGAVSHPVAGPLATFLAGLISSIAPCTLTAIALIVGFVGGQKSGSKGRAIAVSLSFFLGLTIAFVILAAVAQGLGILLRGPLYSGILGLIVFVMGLHVAGIIRLPIPSASPDAAKLTGIAGAFLLGLITATVSAPCATPVLIAVLALASASTQGARGIILITAYALGHWAPVLVAGFTAGLLPSLLKKKGLKDIARVMTLCMGIGLALLGAWLAFTNLMKLI